MPLLSFWPACIDEYSLLFDKGDNFILSFSTTYLCNTAFSAVGDKDELEVKAGYYDGIRVKICAMFQKSPETITIKMRKIDTLDFQNISSKKKIYAPEFDTSVFEMLKPAPVHNYNAYISTAVATH
ncbi:hypothetical protein RF11_13274 [Thelohanellus kitauei]|uniref:Uncharacterized protein n=1 Tax=Thelohanellus kitauei TaxID=669202 RepID=A0A0C2MZ22_THEKT|nr:hypothetical protein RF11_13274 [Thelohanellus kitauei]